jgi:uncharacterized peroxidase-related enzyme
VSEAFAEDPVRLLRTARFAARFGDFEAAPETQVLMQRLVDEGVGATMDGRSRAITNLAVTLSHTPATTGSAEIEALRELEMQDDEILDIIQSVAMFAWANRLMQTLGEPLRG